MCDFDDGYSLGFNAGRIDAQLDMGKPFEDRCRPENLDDVIEFSRMDGFAVQVLDDPLAEADGFIALSFTLIGKPKLKLVKS